MANNLPYQLSSEEKLLLFLCRTEFTTEQKEEIHILIKEIKNWDNFVKLANEHGIIALCWFNLTNTSNSDLVPEKQLEIMHSAYLKSLARNTFLNSQLLEIASLAGNHNIRIIPLKGIALERTVYGNKGLRQMNDIDILVQREHAAVLRNILLKNGYSSAPLISRFHEKIMPAYGKHLPEMYKNGVSVEIHFELFENNGEELADLLFKNSDTESDLGPGIILPEPQLFFIYLISHLSKHENQGDSQLRLYTDLFLLISSFKENILNEKLIEYVIKANLYKKLSEKLKILEIFWNVKLNYSICPLIENNEVESTIVKFISSLNCPFNNENKIEQEHLFSLIAKVHGITNKLLLIIGHIFPSLSYMQYRYKTKTRINAILRYPERWVLQVKKLICKSNQEI